MNENKRKLKGIIPKWASTSETIRTHARDHPNIYIVLKKL